MWFEAMNVPARAPMTMPGMKTTKSTPKLYRQSEQDDSILKEEIMASGDPNDPLYGEPLRTAVVTTPLATPRSQTVLNMYKLRRETITIQANDNHRVNDGGPSQGDAYHE